MDAAALWMHCFVKDGWMAYHFDYPEKRGGASVAFRLSIWSPPLTELIFNQFQCGIAKIDTLPAL